MTAPALADRLAFSILGFTVDLSIELAFRAGPSACSPKRLRGVDEAALLLAHLEVHLPWLWQRYRYEATVTALVRQLLATGTPRLAEALVSIDSPSAGATRASRSFPMRSARLAMKSPDAKCARAG